MVVPQRVAELLHTVTTITLRTRAVLQIESHQCVFVVAKSLIAIATHSDEVGSAPTLLLSNVVIAQKAANSKIDVPLAYGR